MRQISTQEMELACPNTSKWIMSCFLFVLREKGLPLRGEGSVEGFRFKNGKKYDPILCETFYFLHHCVESDEKGYCVPGGDIIFQRNWNEKQIDAILSKRGGKGRESNIS